MIDEPTRRPDEVPPTPALRGVGRALIPQVLASLVQRGEDFDAAEDALQEALLEALRAWPEHPPRDPRAWLAAVATRRLVDARRSETARHRREETTYVEPRPATTEQGDDTLFLLFCCCHPDLAPASQVALTLRAVGGLTTREIADAFYVPEATMAQRISRAKRTLRGRRLDEPGDLAVVLRVLYLIYTAGHTGPPTRVDLAGEAIRLTRQLTLATEEPEACGLLALMLLNHARLPARLDSEGRIVTLDQQDRGLWDTREIAEGVRVLQSVLATQTEDQRPGRYQVEAAIAALHDDAASAEETDWPQILAWYDDLVALTEDPVRQDPAAVLGRAVAVGHVLGAAAGLLETDRLREVLGERHRWHAVRGHLHELGDDLPAAASAYAAAARRATSIAERDHLVRQAARARSVAALIVYDVSTCTTCRALTQLLTERGVDFDAVEYHVTGLTEPELRILLAKTGARAHELLRAREASAVGLDVAALDEDALISAMVANPTLVQRPIVVRGDRAVLARPVDRVLELLDN